MFNMAAKTSGGDPKEADVKGKGLWATGFSKHASSLFPSPYRKVNPVGVSHYRAFTTCLPCRMVNLVRELPRDVKWLECGIDDVKKSCDAAGFLTEKKVNPVGVSHCRAFTACLPRRTVNLVRELPHDVKWLECGINDVKKSCDAAGFLTEKEFICGVVDDEFLLGGDIAIAPEDVNVIHGMVDQNKKDVRVPVQIASHRQHVCYIRGKRPRSEGSSDSSISFCDDDLEGVDLPHNDPLVISLKVRDHPVNMILVDPGSSFNVMYNNLFEMLMLKPEDLKPTSILMSGFDGALVRPMGVVTLPIYVEPVTAQTEFLVVDLSSPYNAIIGRPWLHEMRAVPSTYHQLLKFHLDTGIEAIRGDQRASRECCMIEVQAKEKAKKIVAASGMVAASGIADGCMRSDSGPIAVFDFAKFSEEAETDAKIGGDDSSVADVEKVGASSEHLQVNSLPSSCPQ